MLIKGKSFNLRKKNVVEIPKTFPLWIFIGNLLNCRHFNWMKFESFDPENLATYFIVEKARMLLNILQGHWESESDRAPIWCTTHVSCVWQTISIKLIWNPFNYMTTKNKQRALHYITWIFDFYSWNKFFCWWEKFF
jgi:hypothetical protein